MCNVSSAFAITQGIAGETSFFRAKSLIHKMFYINNVTNMYSQKLINSFIHSTIHSSTHSAAKFLKKKFFEKF